MTIKMVATDIDGTILKHNAVFNPAVIDCIHKLDKSGIKVVLITGRMHASAKKIANELGLQTPIVSYQGAMVKDNSPQENVLYEKFIPVNTAKKIFDWAKERNLHINLYLNDEVFVEKDDEAIQKYANYQHIPYKIKSFDELKLDKINKILLIDYNDAEKITRVTKELQADFPDLFIVKSTNFFCEVCHKEATKGDGLKCVQKYFNISKEETLTIGDHNNDIDLLNAGGIKVAMGNATDELKKVADYVTDTIDNDGFVKAIEKFVEVGANV